MLIKAFLVWTFSKWSCKLTLLLKTSEHCTQAKCFARCLTKPILFLQFLEQMRQMNCSVDPEVVFFDTIVSVGNPFFLSIPWIESSLSPFFSLTRFFWRYPLSQFLTRSVRLSQSSYKQLLRHKSSDEFIKIVPRLKASEV